MYQLIRYQDFKYEHLLIPVCLCFFPCTELQGSEKISALPSVSESAVGRWTWKKEPAGKTLVCTPYPPFVEGGCYDIYYLKYGRLKMICK